MTIGITWLVIDCDVIVFILYRVCIRFAKLDGHFVVVIMPL